jgi:hypothetical protein
MTCETLDPLLTEKELSAWLGLSLPNLQRLRSSMDVEKHLFKILLRTKYGKNPAKPRRTPHFSEADRAS